MAASDNLLPATEPWLYRPSSSSTWISDAFVRDHNREFLPLFLDTFTAAVTSPEGEALTSSTKRKAVSGGKVASNNKRKSRASKGTQTTFIKADAANFRQMVQQVTGGGKQHQFGGGGCYYSLGSNIVKPEPQTASRLLPSTLDTSAFLFDRQHKVVVGPTGGDVSGGGLSGFESSSSSSYSSCFPTLESWKAM